MSGLPTGGVQVPAVYPARAVSADLGLARQCAWDSERSVGGVLGDREGLIAGGYHGAIRGARQPWIRWVCRKTNGGKRMSVRVLIVTVLLAAEIPAMAQETAKEPATSWPGYHESDYIISNYKFPSGETLPE